MPRTTVTNRMLRRAGRILAIAAEIEDDQAKMNTLADRLRDRRMLSAARKMESRVRVMEYLIRQLETAANDIREEWGER